MPGKSNLCLYVSRLKKQIWSHGKDALQNSRILRSSVLVLIKSLTDEDKLREVYII